MLTNLALRSILVIGGSVAAATVAGGLAMAQQPVPVEPVEVRLAVSSFATNATAAHAASSLAVQRVMRAVAQSGVQIDAVESGPMHLVPEYARPDPIPLRGIHAHPRIVGYRATGEVVVRTRDVARIGHLVDFARGAGANELRPVSTSQLQGVPPE